LMSSYDSFFSFLFPATLILRLRVRKRRRTSGGNVLRLIQIRLTASSVEKITPECQANSPQFRVADSKSSGVVVIVPVGL
jgi:hypothetical protein